MAKANTKKATEELQNKANSEEMPNENQEDTNNKLPAQPVEGAEAEDNTKPVEGAVAANDLAPTPGPTEEDPAESTEKTSETKVTEETKKGHVTGTSALRIRHLPNLKSQEMGVMKKGDEVLISLADSTEKFYSIRFGKIEGFCLKEFITLA